MLGPRLFLRMARWARNPPPARMVILVAGIVAFGLVIVAIEHFIGWPDFLTLDPRPPRVPRLQ